MIQSRSLLPLPTRRARRLRAGEPIRRLVRETELTAAHLVMPYFAAEGIEGSLPIASMPGQARHGLSSLVARAREAVDLGIGAVLVFGVPMEKDAEGSEAWSATGISQRAIAALKDALGDRLLVIADLCLCEYTDHGHCGVVAGGGVDNDRTLEAYQRTALAQAAAGADVIAPSGMMDGQVAAIRSALDGEGRPEVAILAYAAKYASTFYGPFREAAGSRPGFGDRRSYQMDPANGREALVELERDLHEGADMLMVKPATAYLDILAAARARFGVPLAAYCVSGEYSMIKAAAERGWLDERGAVLETLTSIRRAGADAVITYSAVDVARWLSE